MVLGISSVDPLSFGIPALALAASIAGALPALRAASADPTIARMTR